MNNLEMNETTFNAGIKRIKRSNLKLSIKRRVIRNWFNRNHEAAFGREQVIR